MEHESTVSAATSPIRLLGRGYDSLMTWRGVLHAGGFRIDPYGIPVKTILVFNTIFLMFSGGWVYAAWHISGGRGLGGFVVLGMMIGLFTCVFFTAFVWYRFRKELSGGPWLVYDARAGTVSLPRVGRSFPVEAVRLQWLYLAGMHSQGDGGSELQLVARQGELEETFLLMTSIFGGSNFPGLDGVFDKVLRAAREHMPMEIMRVAMANRETVAKMVPYVPRGKKREIAPAPVV